jgi:acetyl-CoA carboxylase biotin carboxyl carrier protein
MYKLNEIKELIKLVDSTSIQQLEIENEHGKLSIRKPDIAQVVSPTPATTVFAAPAMPEPISAQPAKNIVLPGSEAISVDPVSNGSQVDLLKIVSPMVGTFYAAPSPDADAFVKIGDQVNEKSVVCIVEAMKLMNEIEAEISGQVVEILVNNGQLVEYGQPLFLLKR